MRESMSKDWDVETLKKEAFEKCSIVKNVKDPKRLVTTMKKLYEQGMNMKAMENYQQAYVYLMRYMLLYTALQKLPDFKENPTFYACTIRKEVLEALLISEELDKFIRQRFEASASNESSKGSTTFSDNITVVAADLENSKTKLDDRNENIVASVNGVQNLPSEVSRYLSTEKLFSIVTKRKSGKDRTLILDLRPKGDFDASRMDIDDVINIPEENIIPGLSPNGIEKECLEADYVKYFKKREEYDWVILVDWCSKEVNETPNVPINEIMTVLTKWDVNCNYKRKPVILVGGYEEWWYSGYPTMTADPTISPPRPSKNDTQFLIDSIDYNSLDFYADILDAEKNLENPNRDVKRPLVNRSTKPSSIGVTASVLENENLFNNNNDKTDQLEESSVSTGKLILRNGYTEKKNDISDHTDTEEVKDSYTSRGRGFAVRGPTDDGIKEGLQKDDDDHKNNNKKEENSEEDEEAKDSFRIGFKNDVSERVSGMKNSTSTLNISKLSVNETRPLIDRSTKPSNDGQFNSYAISYTDEIGRGLTGLKNLRNTCYMNSIIQCLSNTELLRKRLLGIRQVNEQSKTRGTVALALRDIMTQLWNNDNGAVSCKELKTNIGKYRDTFLKNNQEDSHEFLTILIDCLNEDLKDPPRNMILDGANESTGEKAWGEFISKNNSLIRQLFYGQLKSTVRCNVCRKESITFEPFSNLSLPLPSQEQCTLAECFKLYVNNENIPDWQCPGCKTSRDATKRLDITKLPPLLVIHFKRFTGGGCSRKRLTNVDFPNTLDMDSFIIGEEHRNRHYRLYAISNHVGTMESGHYTAYCLNAPSQKWYKFDDQEVIPLPALQKSSSAYIVFYQSIKN